MLAPFYLFSSNFIKYTLLSLKLPNAMIKEIIWYIISFTFVDGDLIYNQLIKGLLFYQSFHS
jgi:hypothetical protein